MQSASDRLDLGRRWRPVLLAYFLRRVRNHAEAEDLTQELIAKLLGRGRGGDFDSPEAYIFQMASNLLADRARRQMLAAYDLGPISMYALGVAAVPPAPISYRPSISALDSQAW